MEYVVIGLLSLMLVGMTVLFVRERLARMAELHQFAKDRRELRKWVSERPTKQEADRERWVSMGAAYKAGWNDAVAAAKAADEAEAKAVATAAKVKAKAKADRLTMK
jgi:hypothetical protein